MWTYREKWATDSQGTPMKPMNQFLFLKDDEPRGTVKLDSPQQAERIVETLNEK